MTNQRPVVGRYGDCEEAARAIRLLVEKGYSKEEIFALAEDPAYFADALAEANALVEHGLSESEAKDYVGHMKVGDVLVLVNSDADHYAETLDAVRQVSEQAPKSCHCGDRRGVGEKVVDYLGQKLFHRKKKHPVTVNARGERICGRCGGIVSSEDSRRLADETVRDFMGQPLFRRKTRADGR